MAKKKIIFLDFDGVMDTSFMKISLTKERPALSDEYGLLFDEECVESLKKIIDATNADIVVTSSGKLDMNLEKLQEMWKRRKLPGNVIDVTPNLIGSRSEEISAWLEVHSGNNIRYIIIDDMSADFFDFPVSEHLINVNPYVGLDSLSADVVIKYFELNI